MPLSLQQEEAIRALDWLFSNEAEDRRTGRTFILAVALLRRSCANPGQWIPIDGFELNQYGVVNLRREIESLAERASATLEWTMRGGRFRIEAAPAYAFDYLYRSFTDETGTERILPGWRSFSSEERESIAWNRWTDNLISTDREIRLSYEDASPVPPSTESDDTFEARYPGTLPILNSYVLAEEPNHSPDVEIPARKSDAPKATTWQRMRRLKEP